MLNQALLQVKDTTIEGLKLINYQQNQVITKQKESDSKEEKILGVIVSLKEYEGKGFKIDLPKLFRMIKRKFKGL